MNEAEMMLAHDIDFSSDIGHQVYSLSFHNAIAYNFDSKPVFESRKGEGSTGRMCRYCGRKTDKTFSLKGPEIPVCTRECMEMFIQFHPGGLHRLGREKAKEKYRRLLRKHEEAQR